jgi:hypothetical protein
MQLVGADPAVGAADPGRVLDRQRGGVDLGAVIDRQRGGECGPQLLEGRPQPADPPVGLGLVRQVRKQLRPVAADLVQETGLAAPAQQMADQGDGQQLGVAAGRHRPGPRRDGDLSGGDGVIDEHVDVDEQILSGKHEERLCGTDGLRQPRTFRRGAFMSTLSCPEQPT